MYTPKVNLETDLPVLRQFVREHPLCTLVTLTGAGLVGSHIPMVLHEEGDGFGTLRGHLARANFQWRDSLAEVEALGIFTGPEHYISPSWYAEKQVHGKVVPTWNYVAVHVYGSLRIVEDFDWMMAHLRTLTDLHEAAFALPWGVDDAPAEFIAQLTRAIVGVELPVTRVEGKWKVSQNRNDADAAGVVAGLDAVGTQASAAIRELVRTRRPR